ncbi:hypothetical protein AgCh_016598 [Apium graveolens]
MGSGGSETNSKASGEFTDDDIPYYKTFDGSSMIVSSLKHCKQKVSENKEALPFPCYYEDIQRCWNGVMKYYSIRLDRTKSLKITTNSKMNKKDVGVKIPFLDKDNYHHWKVKMHPHLLSQDEAYVDCIERDPHVPMRAATGNEPSVPKPRHEWSDPDIE